MKINDLDLIVFLVKKNKVHDLSGENFAIIDGEPQQIDEVVLEKAKNIISTEELYYKLKKTIVDGKIKSSLLSDFLIANEIKTKTPIKFEEILEILEEERNDFREEATDYMKKYQYFKIPYIHGIKGMIEIEFFKANKVITSHFFKINAKIVEEKDIVNFFND